MGVPPGYDVLRLAKGHHVALPLMIAHQCGQAFRWKQVAVSNIIEWSLCLRDRIVFLQQDDASGCLYYRTMTESSKHTDDSIAERNIDLNYTTRLWLQDYLSLNTPTNAWYAEWCERDPIFAKHAQRFAGVNMLRQDPWECMCAFICSSNNNIPRISQMVHKLCDHFTEPLGYYTYPKGAYLRRSIDPDEKHEVPVIEPLTLTYHPFPTPTQLAQPDVEARLRELGFGYRARFIAGAAQTLCKRAHDSLGSDANSFQINAAVDMYLASLRKMSYYDARDELIQLPGIGPKVADCILLMSLDQPSSIPVDRHVFQFAERWYGIRSKRYEDIADRLREIWGDRAGWAHSVLFYADLPSMNRYVAPIKYKGVLLKEEEAHEQSKQEGGNSENLSSNVSMMIKQEAGHFSKLFAFTDPPPPGIQEKKVIRGKQDSFVSQHEAPIAEYSATSFSKNDKLPGHANTWQECRNDVQLPLASDALQETKMRHPKRRRA